MSSAVGDDARLAAAVRYAASGMTIAEPKPDGSFRVVYVNPAFEKLTGYGLDEIVGGDCRLLQGPGSDSAAVERMRIAIQNHEAADVEILNYRKDGTAFWNEVSLTPIFHPDGSLNFYLGMQTDVTARVRVRLTLEERTEMLAQAEQIAHLGHWAWEIESGRVWWSNEVYRMRGLDAATTQPTFDMTMESYHPDDRAAAERILHAAAQHRSAFAYDVRVLRPDGGIRYAHVEGRHLTREGTHCLFGIIQDISERRMAEDEIKRREEQYRRLMETVPLGIKEIDCDGRIRYANPAHDLHLGYGHEQLVGTSAFDLIATEGLRREAEREFREVLGGRPAHFITAYRGADGNQVDVDVRAVAMRDRQGRIDSVITVSNDITERLGYEKRLRELAYYDHLTGLGNRSLFHEFVESGIGRREAGARQFAVALINVDGFKVINEAFGRGTGDFVVKALAKRLQGRVSEREHVARTGGDEFGVLVIGGRDQHALTERLRDLKSALEVPLEWEGNRIDVSLSVGAALWPDHAEDAGQLLQGADTALRDAKRHEPGGIRFYSAEMKTAAEEFMTLRGRLREARERHQFFLEYQPQVDLRTDRIVGLEALVRWRTADGTVIPPTKFIPVAEETGDIVALGRGILEQACVQINAWRSAGIKLVPVSVNLSARQLLQDDLAQTVGAILRAAGVDSRHIELELTETALMVDSRGALRRMQELNDLGIALALDDFGTGYSSLSHLSRFPIQCLKIDRSFIVAMTRSTKQASLVSAVIAMGNRLGLDVMAEGVETLRQIKFLKSHQCDLAQGYYYSKPLSAAAAAQVLDADAPLPVVAEAFDRDPSNR
ncbi:MAG TPA: EAL domain-containing protein [Gammaproteobacteria bacterium]|nr:EAL domain-containing protein [Gammaproteobacteria bacterium]